MSSKFYMCLLTGAALAGLAGCSDVPIVRTNCWASAGTNTTISTKGSVPNAVQASLAQTSGRDAVPCR